MLAIYQKCMFKYVNYSLSNNGDTGNNFNNFDNNTSCRFRIWQRTSTPFFRRTKLKIILNNDDRSFNHIDEFEDKRWSQLREIISTNQENRIVIEDDVVTKEQLIRGLPRDFFPYRRFINLMVKNEGKNLARKCQVNLRLISKTEGCKNPSYTEKSLIWENGQETIDISSKNKRYFHLVFSQKRFTLQQDERIGKSFCKIENQHIFPCAWLATRRALNHEHPIEDSLCRGNYIVAIEVIDDNRNKVSNEYTIKIDDCRWDSLGITNE
jgi:hypothetical protein